MALIDREVPRRGGIWLVDFSPSVGSEIRDLHPALVVSADDLNESPWGLVVVCPMTTLRKERPFRLHVPVFPPEGRVRHASVIRCDQVKSVSIQLFAEKWGRVEGKTLEKVETVLKRILHL